MFETCAAGWRGHYLCDLFYCCSRLCPVLPVCDPLFCCYLRLVVLVVPICASRLSQMLFDWLIVTWIFSHLFSLWVVLIHIHDVCVYWLLVATVTIGRAAFRRIPRTTQGSVTPCCGLLVVARSLRLVILFFEECLELSGGVLLFVVGCLLLCDRYGWSYWFSRNDSNFAGMCYSLL